MLLSTHSHSYLLYSVNFSTLTSLFSLSTLPRTCLGTPSVLVFLSFIAPAFQARPHSLAAQHALGRSRLRHTRPHAQTCTSVLGPSSASLLRLFLSKPQCTPRASRGSFRTLLEAPFRDTTLSETWPPLSTTYSITAQSWIQDAAPTP